MNELYNINKSIPKEFFSWAEKKLLKTKDYQIFYGRLKWLNLFEEFIPLLPNNIKLISSFGYSKDNIFLQERYFVGRGEEFEDDCNDSPFFSNEIECKKTNIIYDRKSCYLFEINNDKDNKILVAFFVDVLIKGKFICILSTKMQIKQIFEMFESAHNNYLNKDKAIIIVNECGSAKASIPNVTLEEVMLEGTFKEEILNNIQQFFISKDLYRTWNIPWHRGIIFIGSPGNGKSMLLKAISHDLDYKMVLLEVNEDTTSFCVRQWINQAKKSSPAIAVVEDLSALWHNPGVSKSYFLNLLDGVVEVNGIFIIATDNHPEDLDIALTQRPSRFDRIFFFKNPTKELKRKYFKRITLNKFSNESIEKIIDFEMSFAFCKEIVTTAFFELLKKNNENPDKILLESFEKLKEHYKESEKAFVESMKNKSKQTGFKFSLI